LGLHLHLIFLPVVFTLLMLFVNHDGAYERSSGYEEKDQGAGSHQGLVAALPFDYPFHERRSFRPDWLVFQEATQIIR
jgi:hypothetical protein